MVEIKAEEIISFSSHQQWINKAASWFRGTRKGTYICVDATGRVCLSGKQFMRADVEGTYPIKVYEFEGIL